VYLWKGKFIIRVSKLIDMVVQVDLLMEIWEDEGLFDKF
jgi:hypothetical protein